MKLAYKDFKKFLKYRTQRMGFNSFLTNFLTSDEINDIAAKVYKRELNKIDRNVYERIFERLILIKNYDNRLLSKMLNKKLIRYDQFFLMKTIRLTYDILGLVAAPFFYRKCYFFQLSTNNNVDCKKKLATYSKNKAREKVFESNKKFMINDYLIDTKHIDDYEIVSAKRITLSMIFQCIYLKLQFFFISPNDIFEVLIAEDFFDKEFKNKHKHRKIVGALLREGPTTISRVIIELCNKYNIKSCVYYTQLILPTQDLPQIELAPTETSKFILNSDRFIPEGINQGHEVYYLNDYPYEDWSNAAKDLPENTVIGVQLGDDWYRWLQQSAIDRNIFNSLKDIGIKKCLARPHPYELTMPDRINYYKKLIEDFPFIELDVNNTHENFLQKISMLITYVPSTLVQQALLYKRQVIVYKRDENFRANSSAIDVSHGLVKSVLGQSQLSEAIFEFSSMKNQQRDKIWMKFLNELNIDISKQTTINDILETCYAEDIND